MATRTASPIFTRVGPISDAELFSLWTIEKTEHVKDLVYRFDIEYKADFKYSLNRASFFAGDTREAYQMINQFLRLRRQGSDELEAWSVVLDKFWISSLSENRKALQDINETYRYSLRPYQWSHSFETVSKLAASNA